VDPLTLGRDALMWADGVDLATASRATPGEAVSGDASLALPSSDGLLLLVVNGLGQGVAQLRVAD
jgi:hypothetical protein